MSGRALSSLDIQLLLKDAASSIKNLNDKTQGL